jgi:hypothetical protein
MVVLKYPLPGEHRVFVESWRSRAKFLLVTIKKIISQYLHPFDKTPSNIAFTL